MLLPWQKKTNDPMQTLLDHLSKGVPADLACRATGLTWDEVKDEPAVVEAEATGEILLFEQARDSGVSGTIRAAMRRETNTWTPKAEASIGISLEDYLKD